MVVLIKKKHLMMCLTIIICISTIFIYNNAFAMQHYYKVDFSTAIVTASSLNVRSGPGTNYKIVANVKKNEYIRVFAGVGDWYVVQVEGDYVGAVNKKYVKPIYPNNNQESNENNRQNSNTENTANLTADEQEVFNLINSERKKQGLAALTIDKEAQNVARIKAQDMVDNNYFSHNSPIYGSPFDMLKSFKVSYKTAGENIAGNSSNTSAVNAWMNSSGHRANILNANFNYTGIGVVSGSKYGKIFVQVFIGR